MMIQRECECIAALIAARNPARIETVRGAQRAFETEGGKRLLHAVLTRSRGEIMQSEALDDIPEAREFWFAAVDGTFPEVFRMLVDNFTAKWIRENHKLGNREFCKGVESNLYFTSGAHEVIHVKDAMRKFLEGERCETIDIGVPFYMPEGGFRKTEVITMAGRPGTGKTTFWVNMMNHVIKNHPTLFFSAEMASNLITRISIASQCGINDRNFDFGLSREEQAKAAAFMERTSNRPLWIDDTCSIDIDDLLCKARAYISTERIEVVAVDHLHCLSHSKKGPYDKVQDSIKYMMTEFKKLARDKNVCVVLLAQMNREADGRSGPPRMSDLYGASAIEQFSDQIIFLTGGDGPETAQIDFHVVKNRNGATGTFSGTFFKTRRKFSFGGVSNAEAG